MAVIGYENYSYRWRKGFVSAASLTTTYEITNTTTFPVFADMGGLASWVDPGSQNIGAKWYNEGTLTERRLSGRTTFLGKQYFTWVFGGLTAQQLDFLLYHVNYFDGQATMDSTLSTWNGSRNRWEIVQAISTRDIISIAATAGYGKGAASRLLITHIVEQDAP